MGGQYGIAELLKVAMLGAEGANVVEDILNKEGLFSLFKLADEASAMASLDADLLLKEVKELDSDDYAALYAAVKDKLDLSDDELEKKLEGGIDLVYQSVSVGLATLSKVQELLALWKNLLSPPEPEPVQLPAQEE
jgi:hypothetical protein